MAVKDYSTTAGSNTSVAGINIAEGCPAANVNNGMRSMMADTRSFYEGATWTDLGHTPVRTGATTFTINSDVTAYYIAGRRIRCTDSSTLYGTIDSSSYSSPNTTVTVTLDSGSLSASLTLVAVSVIDPTGDPIGAASINGLGNETADNLFRVVGSSDATKKLAFEVDGITTGTTRTLTITDNSLTIPANAAGPSSLILAEDTDNGVNTATIIAPSTLAANRTYTLPDEDGTVVTTARTASDTAAGIVELATTAEIQIGTDTARAVTPAGLNAAIGFSAFYESSGLAITAGSGGTLSHGMGRRPEFVTFFLRCGIAEGNYSVGDEVAFAISDTGANPSTGFCVATRGTTDIIYRIGTASPILLNATTGTQFNPTGANWTLVIKAWA